MAIIRVETIKGVDYDDDDDIFTWDLSLVRRQNFTHK